MLFEGRVRSDGGDSFGHWGDTEISPRYWQQRRVRNPFIYADEYKAGRRKRALKVFELLLERSGVEKVPILRVQTVNKR